METASPVVGEILGRIVTHILSMKDVAVVHLSVGGPEAAITVSMSVDDAGNAKTISFAFPVELLEAYRLGKAKDVAKLLFDLHIRQPLERKEGTPDVTAS